MPNSNRPTQSSRAAVIAAGIQKRLMTRPPFTFAGVDYTAAELAALFQEQIVAANKVAAAKGAWLKAIQEEAAIKAKTANATIGLREQVRQIFHNDPEALADFGFTLRKLTPLTPEAHVIAAAKRRATRAARGTMGPKQRLAITGAVPPTIVLTLAQPRPYQPPTPIPIPIPPA